MAAGWALALLAGPVQAAPPPTAYLLDKVQVLGGNPIAGVRDGLIFQRLGCSPEAPRVSPLSGSLGGSVRLAVAIRSCPGNAPAPTGECRLQVGGQSPETFPVSGWTVTLPVALPAATGIYVLALRCTLSGQPEEVFESELFVTYKPPLFPTAVPSESWYRLACTWGAGVKASDLAAVGLEKILHGLHNQGQRYWRYGYCTRGSSACVFGLTVLPYNSPKLRPDSGDLRPCNWWLLTGGDRDCNFTDCFGYSDMLRYLSSTFGIGARAYPPIRGAKRIGFSTHGWLKALDPAAGNLDCGYRRGLGCAFLFGQHSLVQYESILYDATFGQVYRDTGGLIAQNITSKADGVVTLDLSTACALSRPAYGGFMYFRELLPGAEKCVVNINRPAYFSDFDSDLQTGTVELRSVAGDERPELVEVTLLVQVDIAGSYQIYGALLGGPDGEVLVTSAPMQRAQTVYSSAHISGLPDLYEVKLTFSGEDVARSKIPPPYWISATIMSEEGISDRIHRRLAPIPVEGLGEQPVRLLGIAGAERLQQTQGTVLRVSVSVDVRYAGRYAVAASLSRGGRTVAETGAYHHLGSGPGTLEVDFPGEGLDGPHAITVEVHALDAETDTPAGVVDVLTQEVGASM